MRHLIVYVTADIRKYLSRELDLSRELNLAVSLSFSRRALVRMALFPKRISNSFQSSFNVDAGSLDCLFLKLSTRSWAFPFV